MRAGEEGSGPAAWQPRAARTRTLVAGRVDWADVNRNHWARTAIDHVGEANDWMRDFKELDDGTVPFKPDKLETRKLLARAAVKAFAPNEDTDPDITFTDLGRRDRFWRFANVAVKLEWMRRVDGAFLPEQPVAMKSVHRVLVYALGLRGTAVRLDRLKSKDGTRFHTPSAFGTTLLGMRLGLRYNHDDESLDVGPETELSRAEVAWSLYRATTVDAGYVTWVGDQYTDVVLPNLSQKKRAIVDFGLKYVGYPYVWGGEWYKRTPSGYCCGGQPVGGFDCSGWVWWIVKKATSSYDPVPPRDYRGWDLAQRTSADMARVGDRLRYREIISGDLMFYDGSGDGTIDHVNVYVGNGWTLDSSSGAGGVTLLNIEAVSWYRDHFHHARRVIG